MKKIMLVAAIGAILLSGCAPKMYCHLNKNATDFERDKYDCEADGFSRAHQFGAAGNPLIIADHMMRCLEVKHGWRQCPRE